MKGEDLLKGMSDIDEAIIQEAEEARAGSVRKYAFSLPKRVAACAAIVFSAAAIAATAFYMGRSASPIGPVASNTTLRPSFAPTAESETPDHNAGNQDKKDKSEKEDPINAVTDIPSQSEEEVFLADQSEGHVSSNKPDTNISKKPDLGEAPSHQGGQTPAAIHTPEPLNPPAVDTPEPWDPPAVDTPEPWDPPAVDTEEPWDPPAVNTAEPWDPPAVDTAEPWDPPESLPPTQEVPTEIPPVATVSPEISPRPSETPNPSAMPSETPNPSAMPSEAPNPPAMPSEEPNPTAMPSETQNPPAMPSEEPNPTVMPSETPNPTAMPGDSLSVLSFRNQRRRSVSIFRIEK